MAVTREDIADALDGLQIVYGGNVYALTGTTHQPAALAVWQAWPDWQSRIWLTACVRENVWSVYVILPAADAATWTEATDAVIEDVRSALIALGHVSRAEPIALVAADQGLTMPAVNFALTTN